MSTVPASGRAVTRATSRWNRHHRASIVASSRQHELTPSARRVRFGMLPVLSPRIWLRLESQPDSSGVHGRGPHDRSHHPLFSASGSGDTRRVRMLTERDWCMGVAMWRPLGALLRSACSASLLLVVMALTPGCFPIIVPWPGNVRADHLRSAPAGLQGDEGIVVITDGEIRASGRDEEVISCVRHALATSQPALRVFAPDAPVRAAFLDLQEGGEGLLEADTALQKYVTSLRLRYAVFVTSERGQKNKSEPHGSSGSFESTEWHVLNGLVMDLASGLPIGSVRAGTETTQRMMSFMGGFPPWLIVWLPQWTRDGKACMEFGREVAELLRDDKSAGLQNDSQRTRMQVPDSAAVQRPDDQS